VLFGYVACFNVKHFRQEIYVNVFTGALGVHVFTI